MNRKVFCLVCVCLVLFLAGCSLIKSVGPKSSVKVYTTLDKDLVGMLCEKYSDSQPDQTKITFTVSDRDDDMEQADCIISNVAMLTEKAAAGSLRKVNSEFADLLPGELRGSDDNWIILFYDPAVLLVNQAYSRKVGQQQILHWADLPKHTEAQIVMENLTDNESTIQFLAAMCSRMGQNECFSYFRQVHPLIKQYAKFPITPVRMAVTGDADIAVTRRSHVFKYLQNDLPAYILIPEEGTPVNLYGIGVMQNSKKQKEVTGLIDWILRSSEARTVLMTTRSGYLPVLPNGDKGQVVNLTSMWTNTFYKDRQALEKLTGDWLREIRLMDAGEDKK